MTTGHTGAIHDIGYRHYNGPRLGTPYIARALFVHSLRGAFGLGRSTKSKVMPLLLLAVMVVPALLVAAIVVVTNEKELPFEYTSYAVNLQIICGAAAATNTDTMICRWSRATCVSGWSRSTSRDRCRVSPTCRPSCWR